MNDDEECEFESDGGPTDEAYAGRLNDEARNERAGREINALAKLRAAGVDQATCDESAAAAIVGPEMAVMLCRSARKLASGPVTFD